MLSERQKACIADLEAAARLIQDVINHVRPMGEPDELVREALGTISRIAKLKRRIRLETSPESKPNICEHRVDRSIAFCSVCSGRKR